MIDSTNPRQLADNIRKLWDKFKSISGDLLPSRSTATTGQILKLTGENKTPAWSDEYSYTPPAYSETEVNTGQKWIDGKDIYTVVLSGTMPTSTSTTENIGTITTDKVISYDIIVSVENGVKLTRGDYSVVSIDASGNVLIQPVNSTAYGRLATVIVFYTKPDPAPETRDDETPEEPEAKKTTKKKTTK